MKAFAVQRTAVLMGWMHAFDKSKCRNNLFKTILEGLFLKLLLLIQSYFFKFYSEFLGKTPGQNAQKWIPSRSTRRDDDSANDKERHDAIFRKVRG